ncbi:uncharacterized protein AAES06_021986 isoform 1-T2 [Glossophaga mutica]
MPKVVTAFGENVEGWPLRPSVHQRSPKGQALGSLRSRPSSRPGRKVREQRALEGGKKRHQRSRQMAPNSPDLQENTGTGLYGVVVPAPRRRAPSRVGVGGAFQVKSVWSGCCRPAWKERPRKGRVRAGWRGAGEGFLLSPDSHLQLQPDVVLVVGELSQGSAAGSPSQAAPPGRAAAGGRQQEPGAGSSCWDCQDQDQRPRSPRPQGRGVCSDHSQEGRSPKRGRCPVPPGPGGHQQGPQQEGAMTRAGSLSRLQKRKPAHSAACPGEASRKPKETDRHAKSGAGFQQEVRAKWGARPVRHRVQEGLTDHASAPAFQCSSADGAPPTPGGFQ